MGDIKNNLIHDGEKFYLNDEVVVKKVSGSVVNEGDNPQIDVDADINMPSQNIENINNPEFISLITDFNKKMIEYVKKDGTKGVYGDFEVLQDLKVSGSFELNGATYRLCKSPEWIEALVDSKERIIAGVRLDGSVYINRIEGVTDEIENLKEAIEHIDVSIPGDAYAVKDNIKHRLLVDCLGNGDFLTITEACAAINDSDYDNQYEICVYPGTYYENNIQVPPYTHIHGLLPNSVVVSSKEQEGTTSLPVFEQAYSSSKLSNMTIESYTGYCIHFDNRLFGCTLVNENIRFRKLAALPGQWYVVGGGSFTGGTLYLWKSCTFECKNSSGGVNCHTNGNANYENLHLTFKDCKFINCKPNIGSVGGFGHVVATFENCSMERGFGLGSWASPIRNVDMPNTYFVNNCEWQVLGGNNKNMTILMTAAGEGLQVVSDNFTQNEEITVSGSAVNVLFGPVRYQKGGARIKAAAIGSYKVKDEQAGMDGYSARTDVYQMWKRLGDCSVNPKVLTVQIGSGTPMTYTFDQDYLTLKTPETDIIAEVNTVLNGCSLQKFANPNVWDNINLTEKQVVTCAYNDGILKGEWVDVAGNRCTSSTSKEDILGVAVSDANKGESLQVWTGDTYQVVLPNGDYGINDNGELVANAQVVFAKVINNILYKF